MGALLGGHLASGFGAAGADDGEAEGAGQLDGGHADAAGGAVDEDDLAGDGPGADVQGPEGGVVRDADGGPLGVGDVGGQGVDVRLITERLLGVRTGDRTGRVDAVAGLEPGDAGADGLDVAGGVVAGRIGERLGAVDAFTDVSLDRV